MIRATRALAALLLAALPATVAIGPPSLTVGSDPRIADALAAGAAAWTATGAVVVTVEATGCGTGEATACVVWWDVGAGIARAERCDQDGAMWPASAGVCGPRGIVMVDGYDLAAFGAAEAAHEIGHLLGLWYHRTDGLSCMSDPPPYPPYPDAIDLMNLGLSPEAAAAGAARAQEATTKRIWSTLEPVLSLPDTGTGSGR